MASVAVVFRPFLELAEHAGAAKCATTAGEEVRKIIWAAAHEAAKAPESDKALVLAGILAERVATALRKMSEDHLKECARLYRQVKPLGAPGIAPPPDEPQE